MPVASERVALLYDKYADMLYRIAYSQLGSAHDAEDALQDVFTSFISADVDFASDEHEKAWFIRALVNRCHDHQRKAKHRTHDSIDDHGDIAAEDETEKTDSAQALAQLLSNLPEKIRSVIVLHYLEGYSVEEVARLTGSTSAAVKMRLSRGRAMIRKIGENNDV